MYPVSNHDNIIDSRDIITRIEELENEREDLEEIIQDNADELANCNEKNIEEKKELQENYNNSKDELEDWDANYGEELKTLQSLAEEGSSLSADWTYGETLIRENYWITYVQEMLQDIGDLPRNIPHYIVIDWEKTADNIAVDYSTLDFDGVSYYIRAC